jgi:hypothetical protein
MSMKPRLNDGPVAYPNLVTQAKRVSESASLGDSTLDSATKTSGTESVKSSDFADSHLKDGKKG